MNFMLKKLISQVNHKTVNQKRISMKRVEKLTQTELSQCTSIHNLEISCNTNYVNTTIHLYRNDATVNIVIQLKRL